MRIAAAVTAIRSMDLCRGGFPHFTNLVCESSKYLRQAVRRHKYLAVYKHDGQPDISKQGQCDTQCKVMFCINCLIARSLSGSLAERLPACLPACLPALLWSFWFVRRCCLPHIYRQQTELCTHHCKCVPDVLVFQIYLVHHTFMDKN